MHFELELYLVFGNKFDILNIIFVFQIGLDKTNWKTCFCICSENKQNIFLRLCVVLSKWKPMKLLTHSDTAWKSVDVFCNSLVKCTKIVIVDSTYEKAYRHLSRRVEIVEMVEIIDS